MRSLRTRITIMTLFVVVFAVTVVTAMSVFFIRKTEHKKSDQLFQKQLTLWKMQTEEL